MKDISVIRSQINEIDDQIISLLAKRRDIYKDVAEYKFQNGKQIKDEKREAEHLNKLIQQASKENLSVSLISKIYKEIFEDSCAWQLNYTHSLISSTNSMQYSIKVAFLGNAGTYSYLATQKYFKPFIDSIEEINCTSFNQIISSVENHEADFAVLPIENSSSGCINEVYDILQDTTVKIIGELTYPIEHCILAKSNINLSDITEVYAHPQPLYQCSNFLHDKLAHAKLIPCSSSSDAMQKALKQEDPNVVAIGCEESGAIYNLHPIARNIANQIAYISRFIVVSTMPIIVPEHIEAKTSITFTTEDKPGALVNVLKLFSMHNINLVKLQSRPCSPTQTNSGPWAETFYVDIIANVNTPLFAEVMNKLKESCGSIKILGCYPNEFKPRT